MGLFSSLKWFKSQKETELEELKVEEQKMKNELLQKEIDFDWKPPVVVNSDKPYKKLKFIQNVLTIVLQDGSVLTKPNATEKDFNTARDCKTEDDLLKIAFSAEGIKEQREYDKKVEKAQSILKGVETLKNHTEFEVIDNSVYLKGIKRSIPTLLVEKFAEITGRQVF